MQNYLIVASHTLAKSSSATIYMVPSQAPSSLSLNWLGFMELERGPRKPYVVHSFRTGSDTVDHGPSISTLAVCTKYLIEMPAIRVSGHFGFQN